MTVDLNSQKDKTVHGSLYQALTLIFAGLTLLFAVFSIVIGNHLSTLQADHLKTMEAGDTAETTSIEELQTTLGNTQASLEAARQETVAERKKTEKLNQKLGLMQKELAKARSDLDAAQQIIATLKRTPPTKPAPPPGATPDLPSNQPKVEPPPANNSSQPVAPGVEKAAAGTTSQAAVDQHPAPATNPDADQTASDSTTQPPPQPKDAQ